MKRILVVDDEQTLCDALSFNLEVEGYAVDTALSAEEALKLPLSDYSLILLDVMMGTMSGFQMARLLKSNPKTAHIPIIFCSAKDSEDNIVVGLNIGADDYITKPYTIRTVLARVKSVLRRAERQIMNSAGEISYDNLLINIGGKSCIIRGEEIQLTRNEFEILWMLIQNKGKIFSREEILGKVWDNDVIVTERTVDVTITRLRKKIGEYGKNIITRHGYGYGFQE